MLMKKSVNGGRLRGRRLRLRGLAQALNLLPDAAGCGQGALEALDGRYASQFVKNRDALHTAGADPNAALKDLGKATGSRSRRSLRNLLALDRKSVVSGKSLD